MKVQRWHHFGRFLSHAILYITLKQPACLIASDPLVRMRQATSLVCSPFDLNIGDYIILYRYVRSRTPEF
jgi:hypothetical protein